MSDFKLTLGASNLNRLKLDDPASQWFIKSIQWQDYKGRWELLIGDGGSDNYEELKEYFENHDGPVPMRIVQYKVDLFSRSFLNNLCIRNARSKEYIALTDVDMIYGKNFIRTVMENVGPNIFVESRTMYLKGGVTKRIYNGEFDPYGNIDSIKKGRLKKRTTGGGFECMHIDDWIKISGFNEEYKVWGMEDQDLLKRVKMANMKVKWMGESVADVKVFHQHHKKKNLENDLKWQEKNKKIFSGIKYYKANPSGYWGGKKD